MVDPMGRPILAKKLHRAGALFLSLLGFEGRTVHTAAIQLLRNARDFYLPVNCMLWRGGNVSEALINPFSHRKFKNHRLNFDLVQGRLLID